MALGQKQDASTRSRELPNEEGRRASLIMSSGRRRQALGLVGPNAPKRDAAWVSSRRSSTPIVWRSSRPASHHFYSNGTSTGFGRPELPSAFGARFLCKRRVRAADTAANLSTSLCATKSIRAIVERFYQERAIRRIGEAFEKDHDRKALVRDGNGRRQGPARWLPCVI